MSLTASAHSIPGTLRQEVLIDGRHRLVHRRARGRRRRRKRAGATRALPGCARRLRLDHPCHVRADEEVATRPVDVDVEYDHRATPRRFEIDIRVAGDLSDAQLERLEKVAAACPLRRVIETGIEFVERIALHADPPVHEAGAA